MKLKKVEKSYDSYQAEISYLELKTIADALSEYGVGPVSDELHRSIEWHLDRIPKPGESKEEVKAKEEGKERGEIDLEADKLLADPEGEDRHDHQETPGEGRPSELVDEIPAT